MGERPLRYHSFILTVWQETEAAPNNPAAWRFRLADPQTGQQHGFTELTAMMRFLEIWTAVPPADPPVEEII
jgi:hypothetical protein